MRRSFGDDFWGFWMLGGMSGGGMGFIFAPARKAEAQDFLQHIMSATPSANWSTPCPSRWSRWSTILPSTSAARWPTCCTATRRCCRRPITRCTVPRLAAAGSARHCTPLRRAELDRFAAACRTQPGTGRHGADLVRPPAARGRSAEAASGQTSRTLLAENGFDREQHEQIRADCSAAGSAWRKTACRPAPSSRMCSRDDVIDASGQTGRSHPHDRAGEALARGRGGRGHAGRRGGQPLDARGGRGQGAASLLQAGRPAPHVSRSPPGQEPARRRSLRGCRCRTSSPPAI